jgi:ribonuclease HII
MIKYIVGIDEVGRGPVAGPVLVCAVLVRSGYELNLRKEIPYLNDSKKMTEKRRGVAYEAAKGLKKEGKIFVGISQVSSSVIDRVGISKSIQKALDSALSRALKDSGVCESEVEVFLDGGLHAKKEFPNQKTIIGGDGKHGVISLASVIAKVTRDEYMKGISRKYFRYKLEKNKGYGTKEHIEAIEKYGLSDMHRKTFLKRFTG